MTRAKDLNAPENWLAWLRACAADEWSAKKLQLPPGGIAMLTGQDTRTLGAVAHCWSLYARSDQAGQSGALAAVCDKHGVGFLVTPFDIEAVDLLEDIGVTAYKIASGDLSALIAFFSSSLSI